MSRIDRFSAPSLGRALGRGGPRPSLLFPFNHPPTIRCSASGSLDRLSTHVQMPFGGTFAGDLDMVRNWIQNGAPF